MIKVEPFNPTGVLAPARPAVQIRLKGCWLAAAGFPAHTPFAVRLIAPGVLHITRA